MDSVTHFTCQWHRCDSSAVKHAVFGRRVFESNARDLHENYHALGHRHYDLCQNHLEELRRQYIDVTATEIGACKGCTARPRPV